MRTLLLLGVALVGACGGSDAGHCDADAGTPANGGLNHCDNTCRRPVTGYICAIGTGMDRCPAGDGVNDCDCYTGGGHWACTLVLAVRDGGTPADRPDGAPPSGYCRDAADCPPAGTCVFDPDPRETLGRCRYHF